MSARGIVHRGTTRPRMPGIRRPQAAQAEIGPNSVLQTLEALREYAGDAGPALLAARTGLPGSWPDGMIPELWFVRVVHELRAMLDVSDAETVLRRSGTRTGEYVTRNRIPGSIRSTLRILPPRWAVPLLLWAFRRHAWTFAGSGDFRIEGSYPGTLVLERPPTCREAGGPERSCGYYEAAFEALLQLAAPGVRVTETECCAGGYPACRFRIQLPTRH